MTGMFEHPQRITFLLVVTFILTLLVSVAVPAGELETTWRAGDRVYYARGCASEASILQVLEDHRTVENLAEHAPPDDCFVVRRADGRPWRIDAIIVQWISGPHAVRDNPPVSVWQVLDSDGDTVFIYGPDSGGTHTRLEGA